MALSSKTKKLILRTLIIVFGVYILICITLFFLQEKLIFLPEKLDKDYNFYFQQKFKEINIQAKDNKILNSILFTTDTSKGLIFYLHGNAGSLESWGPAAKRYTDLNYDVFMIDYRGYGKSEGSINSQKQLFEDVQAFYNEVKKEYNEDNIIVLGYSIGNGAATKLASTNNPKLLILQAPYYSLVAMMKANYPIIPAFLLKYRFETNKYIKDCKMPVMIFHGDRDEVINYNSSVRLKKLTKETDSLITLKGQGHNGITDNPEYLRMMEMILQ